MLCKFTLVVSHSVIVLHKLAKIIYLTFYDTVTILITIKTGDITYYGITYYGITFDDVTYDDITYDDITYDAIKLFYITDS
jgi:hypothetical protein